MKYLKFYSRCLIIAIGSLFQFDTSRIATYRAPVRFWINNKSITEHIAQMGTFIFESHRIFPNYRFEFRKTRNYHEYFLPNICETARQMLHTIVGVIDIN